MTPRLRLVAPAREPLDLSAFATALALVVTNARRGYGVLYRPGEVNHCPGCSRVCWHVGRHSAECAFCATAIDLERP